MKASRCFVIFYLIFFQIRDLTMSQNSRNGRKKYMTATEVYVTAWEKEVTPKASNSSSLESITHTTPWLKAPFTAPRSQNSPHPASAVNPIRSDPCSQFHVGSLLGGMALSFITTLTVCLGYRLFCSRQQGRYRALEQHDAII